MVRLHTFAIRVALVSAMNKYRFIDNVFLVLHGTILRSLKMFWVYYRVYRLIGVIVVRKNLLNAIEMIWPVWDFF